ncbi:g10625 [Coccomyxa viridis]|uniref:G10625 protein n=1 Tax=Coccomyxa viridis TaxID=1274662 RepID=A0ABP1GA23_9CHLO
MSPGPRTRPQAPPAKHSFDYDLFTLGGGSAGVRAARYSAGMGAKVALCELPRDFISSEDRGGTGGTCVLRGCVPKKLMAIAGLFNEEMQDAVGYGWKLNGRPTFDFQDMQRNKRRELERLSDIYRKNLEKAEVDFIEGRGRLLDKNTVEVNGQQYKAKNILVATGSYPIKAPIEGSEHGITSDEVLNLEQLPEKLVIVGAGYIGCEQACIYNNYGSEVHLIVRQDLPLNGFDIEARKFVLEQYKLRGIKYHGLSSPSKITKESNGKLTVTVDPYKREGDSFSLDNVDQILFATGRKPRTKDIGLEDVGVKFDDKGKLEVDEHSRSNVDNIYAIGDVSTKIPLTPVARMEGTQFALHMFGGKEDAKPDYKSVPSVVFSSPQLAYVGLHEETAVEEVGDVDIYSSVSTPMKNSLGRDGIKELVKVVVSAKDDKVLGFHMVGSEASEIMQGFAAALYVGITKQQLDATVGIHPSSAEEFVCLAKPTRQYRGGKLTEGEEP